MDKNTRQEIREYERGYHAGKDGKPYNDGFDPVVALLTLGFAGGARPGSKEYGKGYSEGREDKKR